jgi:hypothetical protein
MAIDFMNKSKELQVIQTLTWIGKFSEMSLNILKDPPSDMSDSWKKIMLGQAISQLLDLSDQLKTLMEEPDGDDLGESAANPTSEKPGCLLPGG